MLVFSDDEEIRRLESTLKWINRRGVPFATLAALNQAAEGAKHRIKNNLSRRFIIRNKFTERSIVANRARGLDIDSQASEVGSLQEYMGEQEEGFVRHARGKHGAPVPTAYAAGQGNVKRRTKTIRRAMRLSNIRLPRRARGNLTKEQRNIVAVQQAIKTRNRFVFMDKPGSKGIYKVKGGRVSKKGGWPKGATLHLVYSLERKSYRVKPHSWLEWESKRTEKLLPTLYRRALTKQLQRTGFI